MKELLTKKSHYLILAFVVALVFALAYCEDANAAFAVELNHDSNAGTTPFNDGVDRLCGRLVFDTGASFVFCPVVGVSGKVLKDSFELGVADELWPRWEGQITLNRTAGVMDGGGSIRRVVGDGPFNLFLGLSYWIDQSPGSDSNVTFNLGMRYTF